MKRPALPPPLAAVVAVLTGGLALYGGVAWVERILQMGPISGAVLEEAGKGLVILAFGWSGSRKPALERRSTQRIRSRALGAARGISLGLVAVAVFVLAENLAYAEAFSEAGILKRLLWSVPGHLTAALLEALGALHLLRRRDLIGGLLAGGGLILAAAWHAGLNLLASGPLGGALFAGGSLLASLSFVMLLFLFLGHAYLGGFLHGAD